MLKNRLLALTLAMVFVLSIGSVAMASTLGEGADAERGASLRSVAEPVELTADDVEIVKFGDFYYVAIDHNLGDDYDQFVWREPTRLGGENVVDKDQLGYNTLYLGVAGPDGGEITHTGQVSVYYDLGDDGWVSIIVQFDGQGEFLSVNGVTLD